MINPTNIDQNIKELENGNSLTEREQQVFQLVRSVCDEFSQPIIARVAGGWVRDKLIGKPSNDIDIAVQYCTGMQFAQKIQSKLSENEVQIVKIEANPDQSKHLETARVNLFKGFWIDICGLRSDVYAEESRIPQIQNGSPEEDAKRRDFTVNSIFFNINQMKVEDFCGGIEDLKHWILRTPLDPLISFHDDPLRILRGLRFAARFGFTFHDSIIPAAKAVKEDFAKKITRERIVHEIESAVTINTTQIWGDPYQILSNIIIYIRDTDLFTPIFNPSRKWNLNPDEAVERVKTVMARKPPLDISIVLFHSAIFAPIINFPLEHDPETHRNNMSPIKLALSREMRLPVKVAEDTETILKGACTLEKINQPYDRLSIGKWIRETKKLWKYSVFFIFDEKKYQNISSQIFDYVSNENLSNVWDMKPLLNGTELAKLYEIKPGKQLKTLIDDLISWQILNPLGTKESYISIVEKQKNNDNL